MRSVDRCMMSVDDLADGPVPDIDLHEDGTPCRPLVVVDLNGSSRRAEEVARVLASTLAVVVGVADQPLDPGMLAVARAADLTLAPGAAIDRSVVPQRDPVQALERLVAAVEGRPRAAVVATRLLRQAASLPVPEGLAAEAAAYSMLLGGPELATWLADRGPARTPDDGARVVMRREGDVLDIALTRSRRRNAMDRRMREELVEALAVGLADPALRVRLSGEGKSFCSGGDLDEFGSAQDYVAAYLVRLHRHPGWLLHRLGERGTAYLHGACVGAGIEIPAFAGRVVAAPDTRVMLPELQMGMVPGAGGTVSISRRIGRWRTAWLALSGEWLDSATALEWGLVDAVDGR